MESVDRKKRPALALDVDVDLWLILGVPKRVDLVLPLCSQGCAGRAMQPGVLKERILLALIICLKQLSGPQMINRAVAA